MIQVGQIVETSKMNKGSFYKQVRGTVRAVQNGFVEIDATEVIDLWSSKWSNHPTSCRCSTQIENVKIMLK